MHRETPIRNPLFCEDKPAAKGCGESAGGQRDWSKITLCATVQGELSALPS
jgi:hypothetical protein